MHYAQHFVAKACAVPWPSTMCLVPLQTVVQVWQKDKKAKAISNESAADTSSSTDGGKVIDIAEAENDDMLMCMVLCNRYFLL
jgi:hypothetical protein